MNEDLRTLSEQISKLVDNFVNQSILQACKGAPLVIISLPQIAPKEFPTHLIAKYLDVIQAELNRRPEINNAHIPQSIADFSQRKAFEPLVLIAEVDKAYRAGKKPRSQLSLSRWAEIGTHAVEYMQEESDDVVQDLTERLGLSLEEVSLLEPSYQFPSSPGHASSDLDTRIQSAQHRSVPVQTTPIDSQRNRN